MRKLYKKPLTKIFSIFLATTLIFARPMPVSADNSVPGTADSDKFNQAVVHLNSAQDLFALEKYCSLDTYSRGKTFLLEQDIDLGDTAVTIPSFGGIFDGRGHTVSGLMITGGVSDCGLFAYVQETGVFCRAGQIGSFLSF